MPTRPAFWTRLGRPLILVLFLATTAVVTPSCSTSTRGQETGGASGGLASTGGTGNGGSGSSGATGGEPGLGAGGTGGSDGSGDCTPSEVGCDGLVPQECGEDGMWRATRAACAIACTAGACASCEEDATECRDGAVQRCVDGAWTPEEVCAVACEAGACVDACTPDRLQCNGDLQLQRCDGTAYVDEETCDFLCIGDKCAGDCAPDTQRCDPSSPNAAQSCSLEGNWGASTACDEGSFCVDGKCKPCEPTSVRCAPDGTGPQTCSTDGEWVPNGSCEAATPACFEGKCVLCAPGSRQCSANVLEECASDGQSWSTVEACSGETPACIETTLSCGRCLEGDVQCSNDTVQKCDDAGTWQDDIECSGTTPQCFGGACVACDPDAGERRCQTPTVAQACASDGAWGATTNCAGELPECRDDLNSVCGCEEGERRCKNNTVPERCQGGIWVAQSPCSGTLDYCLPSTGTCVDCAPNATQCQSGVAQQCSSSGSWQSLNSCTGPGINCGGCDLGESCGTNSDCTSGICVNGKCAECSPSAGTCSGSTPVVCNSSGTWVTQAPCSGAEPKCNNGSCVECTSGTQSCGTCNLGSQSCQSFSWGSCSGAPNLQTSNSHCGSCNNACGSRESCQSGNCRCSSGNHGCGGSTPPCYADTDGDHCGSACVDCSDYHGTTGTCSGGTCSCNGMNLDCGASEPSCGTWDFQDNTTQGWRAGSFDSSQSGATGSPAVRTFNGSRRLAVDYSTSTGSGIAVEVDLCPNDASISVSGLTLSWDIYITNRTGTGTISVIPVVNSGSVLTACQGRGSSMDPNTEYALSCGVTFSSGASRLQLYVSGLGSSGLSEIGTVYFDNIRFGQ